MNGSFQVCAKKPAGRILLFAGAILFGLAQPPVATSAGEASGRPAPFADANVRLEQNATDQDVEVVFEVKAGDKGLSKLSVVAPDGRTVVDFSAPDATTMGIRQFSFESPEPRDVQRLKAAYPQGVYTFDGITADGEPYHSTSALNHALPATVAFIRPKADARAVGTHDVQIAWTPVKHLAAYIIEIQHAALGVELTAKLPAPASTFAVPNGYLLPGEQYQLSIGTISKEGNISFVETTFTTAENAK